MDVIDAPQAGYQIEVDLNETIIYRNPQIQALDKVHDGCSARLKLFNFVSKEQITGGFPCYHFYNFSSYLL